MKSTKRSLLTSVVAFVLCIAMLLSTTYAWFTGIVTSSTNIIQSGNLDVEMYWSETLLAADSSEWENADGVPIFTYDNWEPGYTDVKYLKVKNVGNLALQWRMSLAAEGEVTNLVEVIDVYYINPVSEPVTTLEDKVNSGTLSKVVESNKSTAGVLLPDGEVSTEYAVGEVILAIALHMQDDAGNEYQGRSIGDGFAVSLIATQFTYESDSFNNTYDENTQWPNTVIVGGNTATATVIPTADNKVSAAVSLLSNDGVISADVPAGVKLDAGVNRLTLSVKDVADSKANVTLSQTEAAISIDVHIDGVAADNDVVIAVGIKELLPKNLNMGNYRFYHVENGDTVEMTLLATGATPVHNDYEYDPATGSVILYLESFSEVALVADNNNTWKGTVADKFAGGNGTESSPYLIANADQFAYLGYLISNDNENYGSKSYKLIADVDFGGQKNANEGNIFYPIGYSKVGGSVATLGTEEAPEAIYFEESEGYSKGVSTINARESSVWYTYGGAFKGVFDGNGNTIKNIYQNTWLMKGNYDGNYWNAAMGIFGYVNGGTVKNLTVDNFTSDGEFTPTGVVAAYAVNASFENITITNCNPRVYNTGNGGIVGIGGNEGDTGEYKLTFTNITVDKSNKISALWGSWDVACGGIMGMFRGNGLVHFENCNVGAQLDVYNDVCGNYQYYWYRYSGMMIGTIKKHTTDANGYTIPDTTGITAEGCTVNFGQWNDYYYCELVANTLASYTHDHQFSRLTKISSLDEIKSGDTWTKTGNFLYNGECYHIVNKDGVLTRHLHEDAGTETVNGATVLKEDKQRVYLPFNQVFQGYGWGVLNIGFRSDSNFDFEGITIGDINSSVDKFKAIVNGKTYEEGTTVTIGEIFAVYSDVSVNLNTLMVFVSPVGEESTAGAVFTPNTTDWTKGTLTFNGSGAAKIVITDYTYCKEATALVTVDKHEHIYNTTVTLPTCTEKGYTTYACACGYFYKADEVAANGHNYNAVVTDPDCENGGYTTYTCTVCDDSYVGDNIVANGHTYSATVTAPTCTVGGYTTYTCACGDTYVADEVEAKGHSYNAVVTAPTCTEGGYTTYTCACGDTYVADEVAPKDHSYNAVVTAPTCTEEGYTTYTCACGDKNVADKVEALGHSYNATVTAPTCTSKGYTTYTCACGDTYTADEVAALGHIETNFTGDFLYRVGNANGVALGSLFNDVGAISSAEVTIENVKGSAAGTCTQNTSEWAKSTIKFSGTGIVKITLSVDYGCEDCDLELELEVVDAVNATSATSAKNNNVVLLNDVSLYTIEVSGGYTLYGNGFKMTATSDPMYDTMRAGFVTLDNGTLDNVQVICPNFSYAIIYNNQIKDNANTAKPSDSTNDARGNVRSAVMVTGNSKIVNSYIHGGRAAIFLRSGNLLIDGSTISGGAAANIHALSAQSLTLRNATLIQKPFKDNVHGTGKTLMGFSVLLECGADGNSTPVILEGTLVQDAWINADYIKYTPSNASSIVENALGKTAFLHDLDGDGKNESLNLGFTYIPQDTNGSTEVKVNDNRTNKDTVPYAAVDVGAGLASAKVYSYKNTNGTSDGFKNVGDYVPTAQGVTAPTVSFTDTNADRVFETKFDSNDGRWESSLTVSLDNGNYTFNWDKLLVQKHGENLIYTAVKTADGIVVDTSKAITLTASGVTEYVITVTDGDATHTIYFTLTASKTSIPDPVVSDTTGGTPLLVVKSKNSDWSCALPALEGIKVKYYTADGEVILDLATLTPTSTGKQNGTNNYWKITKDGYKLKVTCGVIHDTKSVYGMPVVVNNGGNKLYFTISSTNGYVSTNTSGRTVTITYEFTDPNGKTLTFSKTWQFNYADYKNGKQYSYSDFVNGTLKEASSGGCVTPDTLVTLADGTQKRIDQVTYNDRILVWNFYTGKYDVAFASILMNHGASTVNVTTLNFSDGTSINTINGHGFFDVATNEFVLIDEFNAADYIGHSFVRQDGNGYSTVELVSFSVEEQYTEVWSILTAEHYNCVLEGMWTVTAAEVDNSPEWLMPYEIGEDMKYDEANMQADIEKYGLYTYEDFENYSTYEQFVAFGFENFKVSVAKGYITWEEIEFLLSLHVK